MQHFAIRNLHRNEFVDNFVEEISHQQTIIMKRTIIFILAALAMMQCKAQSLLMPEQESNVMNEKRAVVEEQARFASTEQYADLCIKQKSLVTINSLVFTIYTE